MLATPGKKRQERNHMADKTDTTPRLEIRSVPGDAYQPGIRAADALGP
jgi:hypothetical protein